MTVSSENDSRPHLWYNSPLPWVPTRGITGKSGTNPARSRHCESRRAASRKPLGLKGRGRRSGQQACRLLLTSQETYPRSMRLTFCGEQRACVGTWVLTPPRFHSHA